jgi:hypothetical protein
MAKMFIDHVAVDVRIRLKTTTIGRIAQAISLLLNMFPLFCALLANLLNILHLLLPREVLVLYLSNPIFILLLEGVQLVHSHVHQVAYTLRIGDHHGHIWRKLI